MGTRDTAFVDIAKTHACGFGDVTRYDHHRTPHLHKSWLTRRTHSLPFPLINLTIPPSSQQTLKSRDSKPRDVTYGDDLAIRRENKGQYARTETTEVTSSPEFQNKAFVMTVPRVNNQRALHPTGVEDLLDGKDWPGFGVTEGGAAEGVALGDGPPALVCQLYGARSAGHSVMGQDVLIGQGYVEFFGATVERLARGEAVSITVTLEHPEGRAPSQVSLQVTMLDTDAGVSGQVATRDGRGAGRTVRVSILVHGATNLNSGEPQPPAAFVAAKTMREAAARLPSRAATRAVPKTIDPVWDEVVSVEVAEHELDREKVLLAVVNHDTNKLMAKAAVPLKALEVGRHYGLALDLGSGAVLNVTVVIPQAPARELEYLKQNNDHVRVEGSITGISGECGVGFNGPVTAVWSMSKDSAAARAAPGSSKIDIYHACDASDENNVVNTLVRTANTFSQRDVVPVLQGSALGGPPLWPTGHRAVFYTSQSSIQIGAAIVLELMNSAGMIARAVIPVADLGSGGRPTELNHVPLICGGGTAAGGPNRGEEVGKVSLTARAWPRESLLRAREKEVAAGFDGGGGLGVGGEGAWMLSAMATDMIDKQQALDEAIVLLDRERKRTQSLTYKCDEASSARQRLESDNQELRRLLHEERNADPAAGLEQLGLGNINDVMEAKERLGQLASRYGQEKRRNAELIHRLKSLHEAQAGAEQLKGRHLELQEAHAEMSRYLQKCEREASRVGKCRATIEMQEGVISRLEGLLEQAAVDQRRLAEAEALASRVQDANSVLQSGPDWEELSMLRDEVKDLRAAYQEREQEHRDLQNERIALTLRVEKSEANAIASNNEMLEVSRRCAREIAGLRSKLAEKDAQLMGGFGSVANMILAEMPAPPRLSTMEPMPPQYAPESRPHSPLGKPNKKSDSPQKLNLQGVLNEHEKHAGEKENAAVRGIQTSIAAGSEKSQVWSRPGSRHESHPGSRPASRSASVGQAEKMPGRPSSGAVRDAPARASVSSRPSTGGTTVGSRPATGKR